MQAEITYTRDTGEKLVNETFGPNNIRRRTSGMEERHRVDIANGREARDLALDKNGFVLVEHRTAVRDFFDADELKRVYYPEVQKLIGDVAADALGVPRGAAADLGLQNAAPRALVNAEIDAIAHRSRLAGSRPGRIGENPQF